jgi:hypothetical protein
MQPRWKFVGSIGDVDPIAYGGGFVYEDELGNYSPEMDFLEPAPDGVWEKMGDKTPLHVFRIILENDATAEWWYERLDGVAKFVGCPVEELQQMAKSDVVMEKALLYQDLVHYFGFDNFDPEPLSWTEGEAYIKYASEMEKMHERR